MKHHSVTAWRVSLALALMIVAARPLDAATIFNAGPNDEFSSLAITTNGTIVVAGSRDQAAGFFKLEANSFGFTPLAPLLPGGLASAYRFSADGTLIVGYSESPNTSVGYEATLWNVGAPTSPVALGFAGGNSEESLAAGVTTVGSATIVVGESSSALGSSASRWTLGGGVELLPRTGLPALTTSATGISSDGTRWSGNEDPSGPNSIRAVYGDSLGAHVLDALGNPVSTASNISRYGSVIVGAIGDQAAFWSGSSVPPTLVTSNGVAFSGTALASDGGYVVGTSENDNGWICSVSDGHAKLVEDWVAENWGLTLKPGKNAVNDILVVDHKMYLLLQGGTLITGSVPLRINIVPPQNGTVTLRFPTEAGKRYHIESIPSFSFGNWIELGPAVDGNGAEAEFSARAFGNMNFYRIRVED
jgi:uncharacterized membrane protein